MAAVAALVLFERSSDRVREQRFVQQVTSLTQGVRDLYANSGAPPYGPAQSVDITARLLALALDTQSGSAGSTYRNAYGRIVTVTTDGPFFTVTSEVAGDACVSAWQKLPGLAGIAISGGSVAVDLSAPFDSAAQLAISNACSGTTMSRLSLRFQ